MNYCASDANNGITPAIFFMGKASRPKTFHFSPVESSSPLNTWPMARAARLA
jgi:hypothetical protein